jgi:hypothetical protein
MTTYFAAEYTGLSGFVIFFLILIILGAVLFIFLLPWLFLAAHLKRKAEQFRQERSNTVIAQYDPPHDLSPAEVGLLYDLKCDDKEVRATLFDLEGRGIVAFTSVRTVTIRDQAAYEQLMAHEQIAVRMFDKQDTQQLSTQTSATMQNYSQEFSIAIPSVQLKAQFTHAVQKSLASKGYPTKGYTASLFRRVLWVAFVIGLWPLSLAGIRGTVNNIPYGSWSPRAFGLAFGLVLLFGLFLFPVYLIFSYLTLRVWVAVAGRSWLANKQTRAIWPELEGYRLFLKETDLDNIQFDSEQGQQAITKTMPYAMVFNLDTKWRQRLERLQANR